MKNTDIRSVLRPVALFLGTGEVIQSNIVGANGAKMSINPVLPRRLKTRQARYFGKQVDPNGGNPHLDDPSRIDQILDGIAQVSTAKEVAQRRQSPPCIRRGGLDQDVKVSGRARTRVEGDRVGADHQIPHPMGVQCGDELFVVLGRHRAPAPSGTLRVRHQLPQHVPPG